MEDQLEARVDEYRFKAVEVLLADLRGGDRDQFEQLVLNEAAARCIEARVKAGLERSGISDPLGSLDPREVFEVAVDRLAEAAREHQCIGPLMADWKDRRDIRGALLALEAACAVTAYLDHIDAQARPVRR